MKKIILGIFVVLLLLVGIILVKTWIYPFAKLKSDSQISYKLKANDSALYRFSKGIQIPTISTGELGDFDYSNFDVFKTYLEKTYPLVYARTEHYVVNQYAMVFKLKGRNSTLKPILFLSHIDVVPAGDAPVRDVSATHYNLSDKPLEAATEIAEEWDYAPFSGTIANGRIYGRGTLDMKGMLFSLMEAMTHLISEGVQPERDIYLAFGFDEEVGGRKGAVKLAEDFSAKGLEFDAVYDEGGVVLEKGSIAGINSDVALIGCAEKGFLSAKIKVKGLGGHSSMPPLESAIGKAAIIMQRLEKNQLKPQITPLIQEFFNYIGGQMPFSTRLALANRWLLEPMLLSQLSSNNSTNALVRTTTALTMMKGSDGTNVLSPEVEFVVNFRLLPGNTIQEVKEHLVQATKGFDVEIEEIDNTREASAVSSTDTKAYQMIEKGIREIFPDVIITPYLTVGGTDAYKYQIVSKNIYRFIPFKINNAEQQSIHSTNEYISIENYMKMMHYFEFIMKNYDR